MLLFRYTDYFNFFFFKSVRSFVQRFYNKTKQNTALAALYKNTLHCQGATCTGGFTGQSFQIE